MPGAGMRIIIETLVGLVVDRQVRHDAFDYYEILVPVDRIL